MLKILLIAGLGVAAYFWFFADDTENITGEELIFRNNNNYCRDTVITGIMHPGKRCYREINPPGKCSPGNQVCFDINTGARENSPDSVSPMKGKAADGTCIIDPVCAAGHLWSDVVFTTPVTAAPPKNSDASSGIVTISEPHPAAPVTIFHPPGGPVFGGGGEPSNNPNPVIGGIHSPVIYFPAA